MKTIIILSVFCVILSIMVLSLVWFVRRILAKLLYVSESMGDFLIVIDNFSTHLEQVNSMETYYGDETLQSLVEHSRVVVEEIEQFEAIYSLTTEIDEAGDEQEPQRQRIAGGRREAGDHDAPEQYQQYGCPGSCREEVAAFEHDAGDQRAGGVGGQ